MRASCMKDLLHDLMLAEFGGWILFNRNELQWEAEQCQRFCCVWVSHQDPP